MVEDRNSRMAAPVAEIRDQIRQILTNKWCGSKAPELTKELGLWYDPNFSGHGLEIQKIGSTYSGIFYTFAQSGKPEWYILSVENQTDNLTGNFLRVENRGNSYALDTEVYPVGVFTITFNPPASTICHSNSNNSYAQMTWSINDEQGVWCLQPLLTVNSRTKTNPNGWWWNGSNDSGWGFDVYANETTEFRVVYYYGEASKPIWVFALNDIESESFTMQAPTEFCRTCDKIPLQSKNIGRFDGSIMSSSINAGLEPTTSLDIENRQRIDFIPQFFPNPAY